MKNVTSHFSPSGNSSHSYSDNSKYKNVKLVPVSDAGYQAYRISQITKSKTNRPADYIPNLPTPLCQASGTVEFIVREWYGSSISRIIQYDVLYQGIYHRHYKECDIIRFESDGSLTIGEIKSSYNPSAWKALSQLQHSCEILSDIYLIVNPVAITVNMVSENITSNLNYSEITEHRSESDFLFSGISLSLGDITEYANTNSLNVDFDLLVKANVEALTCSQKKAEKQDKHEDTSLQPLHQSETYTMFGMQLQNALGLRNSNFQPL